MITLAPQRRTRVLHIVQNLNYGGMERLIREMVRCADPTRFEPHVLVLQYLGHFSDSMEETATLHVGPAMTPLSLLRPTALARTIRAIAPDVVHTHSGVWLKAARAARMAGVPRVVHTEHGRRWPDRLADRVLDRLAARETDVIVAVSPELGRYLGRSVVRDSVRIRVISNGVDTERFRPGMRTGEVRRNLSIPPDVPVLGSIGRLEPIKGYDVMVRALADLRALRPPGPFPVLLLAGDGSERARLEILARELGVADSVRFLGWRDDIDRLHQTFDVFTLSSHSEGTSMSLLEAMSAGLCPVVTDVGGNAAVLGGELAHRLVPTVTPGALARGWFAALADPRARARDAERARDRVTSGYSISTMVASYEKVYLGAPAVRPGRRRRIATTR